MNREALDLLARCEINPVQGVIDCSAWIGQYPFRGIERAGVAQLQEQAGELGIERVIVSPFEGIFQENGLDAYARAAAALADVGLLDVWPVVRPGALLGLEALLDRYGPRGMRLVPGYHGYHLYDPAVETIMRIAREREMVVQVFTRIADERWHWMLKVPELPMHDIEYAVSAFDQQALVVCGLNRPQSLAPLMKVHPLLYSDVSRVRGPVFGMEQLVAEMPIDRVMFGSLWPIQIVEATLWQVISARIDPELREAILGGNARRLFSGVHR